MDAKVPGAEGRAEQVAAGRAVDSWEAVAGAPGSTAVARAGAREPVETEVRAAAGGTEAQGPSISNRSTDEPGHQSLQGSQRVCAPTHL